MPNNTTNIIRFGAPSFEALEPIKEALKGPDFDDGTPCNLDFNRLVPMPEDLRTAEESSTAEYGRSVVEGKLYELSPLLNYQWVKDAGVNSVDELVPFLMKRFPDLLEKGRLVSENVRRYGFRSWYDWAKRHWGTKWNAYSIGDWTQGGPVRDWNASHEGQRGPDGGEPMICFIQLRFQTAWCVPAPIIDSLGKLATDRGVTFDHWFSDEDGGSRYDPEANDWVTIYEANVESSVDWANG